MEQLKVLREERGLSRRRVAVLAGLDPATVHRIENGERSPTVETLEKLADALSVEVADFFPKADLEHRAAVLRELPPGEQKMAFSYHAAVLEREIERSTDALRFVLEQQRREAVSAVLEDKESLAEEVREVAGRYELALELVEEHVRAAEKLARELKELEAQSREEARSI